MEQVFHDQSSLGCVFFIIPGMRKNTSTPPILLPVHTPAGKELLALWVGRHYKSGKMPIVKEYATFTDVPI